VVTPRRTRDARSFEEGDSIVPRNTYESGYFRIETIHVIAAALRRHTRLVAICFVSLSAGIIAAFLSRTPLYEGDVKFLIKQDRADSLVSGLPEAEASGDYYRGLTETEVMSQVELLRSRDLVERVAVETGLAARLRSEDPDLTEIEAVEQAADALEDELDVWPVKRTWLINVAYAAEDRRFTRNVLDTLSRVYLEKHLALQRPAGTYEFFDQQARQAKQELDDIRTRLAWFSTTNQVASASVEKEATLQRLNEFEALQRQAAAQLAETERRLVRLTSEWRRVPRQHTSTLRTDTGTTTEIRNRILTLEMQRTQLLQKFTPAYRGVQQVDDQLREARTALHAAEQTPVIEKTIAENPTWQWLDAEVARVSADEAAIRARLQALASSVEDYRTAALTLEQRDAEQQDLTRELKVAEDKYLLYAQKREEARISDELDRTRIANVVIAEGPGVSTEAARDPSLALLPLLLVVALFVSGGAVLAYDALTGPTGPALERETAAVPPPAPEPAVAPAAALQPAVAATPQARPPIWGEPLDVAFHLPDAKRA
jgi:uncharacterized protein involved in exopolysaccharide biosynthesis